MRPSRILAACALVLSFCVADRAWSYIGYEASAGFFPPPYGFNLFRGYDFTPAAVDSGEFGLGGLCPAPGTPNFLCGRARGASGINGGRLFLKAEARLKRSDASADLRETSAYGGARVTISGLGGFPAAVPGGHAAAFYFRLDGTRVQTGGSASVQVFSQARASLYAGTNVSHQCFGDVACPIGAEPVVLKTTLDQPYGFVLDLRVDASMVAQPGVSGWSAEAAADFFTTMELLAIAILDENGQPRSDVQLYFTDENGDPSIMIPNAPPEPSATATPTPLATATVSATPTPGPALPTPTATSACANPPCEQCSNCLDDDGDQLVDGADALDCPASDGGGAGLPAPRGKAALKCEKAIAKASGKLAVQRATHLNKCLLAGFTCVQEKPTGECWDKVAIGCAKELATIGKDEGKLSAAIVKACGAKNDATPPLVSLAELRDASGLGYAAAEAACESEFGASLLSGVSGIAACVARQHACRIDAAIGSAVPRAAEILIRSGRDPATELPCLAPGADGGLQGLGPKAKAKAASGCQAALAAAGVKHIKTALAAVQRCATAVYACVQQQSGDAGCLAKARATCAKSVPALAAPGGNDARLAVAVAKACGVPGLDTLDLTVATGLGFGSHGEDCAALGVSALDGPAPIATCVTRRLACRTGLLLDLELPRWRELLGLGQVATP